MNIKYVVAIVPRERLESLERKLHDLGVGGITLSRVRGFGEYKNFFSNDWLTDNTKVEIFTDASRVEALLGVLLKSDDSDAPGAGIVAVMPTERFLHLRTGTETLPGSPMAETR